MSRARIRNRRTCRSGKIRYRDGDQAGLALRQLKGRAAFAATRGGRHTIRVVRKYECEWCGGWHLTSRPGLLAVAS